jgi:hypothetical protein
MEKKSLLLRRLHVTAGKPGFGSASAYCETEHEDFKTGGCVVYHVMFKYPWTRGLAHRRALAR